MLFRNHYCCNDVIRVSGFPKNLKKNVKQKVSVHHKVSHQGKIFWFLMLLDILSIYLIHNLYIPSLFCHIWNVILNIHPCLKSTFFLVPFERGVGLELLHITLLVTGVQYILSAAYDCQIFSLTFHNDLSAIYALIKIREQ